MEMNLPVIKLETRNLTKKFSATEGVADISLQVYEHELLTLLGPSGCGKTTILRAIGGFNKIDSGKILLDGAEVQGLPPEKRPTGMVFQSYNLIDYLTPLENVKLGGKGDPKALLGSMGIGEEYWNRSVLQLSGGQQQRVAIARALASDAKVLLADEPTGNLDEATAWDVIDLLKHIAHEEKKCVIVVTHSKELAQAADEVIHIGSIHAASSKPNF